jgi:hypothetical protein
MNKEQTKIHHKQYYQTHKELWRQYYQTYKARIEDYKKQYRKTHKEEIQIYMKQYHSEHRDDALKKAKVYRRTHSEKRKEWDRKYRLIHSEQEKERHKKYRQSPEGKITVLRGVHKRYRNLGFVPLNEYFKNSVAHHIDLKHVIYIPRELHESISHNIITGKNMHIINALAVDYIKD